MHIKNTLSYNHRPIRMAKTKNSASTKCERRGWETRSPRRCWGQYSVVRLLLKTAGPFLTETKHAATKWPSTCIPRCLSQKNRNFCFHKKLYTTVYSSFIWNGGKPNTTQMSFTTSYTGCGMSAPWNTTQWEGANHKRRQWPEWITELRWVKKANPITDCMILLT